MTESAKELNQPKTLSPRYWLIILLLALVLGVIFAPSWLPLLGRWLVINDSPRPADAIVPLAGEGIRARYAANLFREGYADWFVVTNPPIDIPGIHGPYVDLAQEELLRQGIPAERIVAADERVQTTKEEAQAVRRLAEDHAWRSLLVVTSPYHTRRSRIIFDQVFRDSETVVQVVPVEPHPYDEMRWWEEVGNVQATTLEYLKFLAHLAGYH